MATGTFVSHKRVERDGVLVAFEGEEMTMEEAVKRGLTSTEEDKGGNGAKKSKDDLIEEAKALGIDVPKKVTVAKLQELIAAAGTDEGSDIADNDSATDGEGSDTDSNTE